MRRDPGEVTMLFKDFTDAQAGQNLLHVVCSGDVEPGHPYIHQSVEERRTGVKGSTV